MTHRERLHELVDTLPAWQVDALLTLLEEPSGADAPSEPPPAGERDYDEVMPHLGL